MTPTILPAHGLMTAPTDLVAPLAPSATDARLGDVSTFELAERLLEIWGRNQRRLEALDAMRGAIASARRYLETPGCHRDLGEARLARLVARRDACLEGARADRDRARALLIEGDDRVRRAATAPRRAVGS